MKVKNLSESAVLLVLGKGFQAISGFALLIFLVRMLDKEAFAAYQLYVLVAMTLSILMSMGLSQSYFYYLPKLARASQLGFIIETIRKQFYVFVGLSVIIVITVSSVKSPESVGEFLFWLFLVAATFFLILYESLLNILVSLRKGDISARYSLLFGILYFSTQLFVLSLYKDAELIFISWVCVYGVMILLIIFYLKKLYSDEVAVASGIEIRDQFGYSLPLWGSYAIGQLNLRLDGLIIASFFASSIFALFNVGAREIPLIGVVSYSLTQIIMPSMVEYFAEGNKRKFIEMWHKAIKTACYITYPVFFILFFFSHEIIALLYTDAYLEAVEIFRIYLVLILLRLTAYGQVVSVTGRTRVIFKAVVVCFVINVLFSFGMLKPLGWTAPAYGTVIAQFSLIVMLLYQLSSALDVRIKYLMPYRYILLIALIALTYSAGAYLVFSSSPGGLFYLMLTVFIYFLAYLATIWFSGIIESREKKMIKDFINKLNISSVDK